MTESSAEMPCVGGFAYDADGRMLLVRRWNEAGRGLWPVEWRPAEWCAAGPGEGRGVDE